MANSIYSISAIITLISVAIAFIRMVKGPTLADRVVAMDGMTIIVISLIVYLAYFLNRIIYLDVALVYALVSFIGVIAIARYLERGL
ncbi:MAG: monovalent cation/H+ antiporter complex subunit F [Candidatus Cloacimonadota bacterium]|nr:monovalent cation/H+ antiporter complex subunit F [Candidatus Cloacimonadota bacterium]